MTRPKWCVVQLETFADMEKALAEQNKLFPAPIPYTTASKYFKAYNF